MENLKRKVAAIREAHDLRSREMSFAFGEQDQFDLMSYSGMAVERDHLYIDDTYIRTLFISGYPLGAHSGWLDSLVNFSHNSDITFHLHEIDPGRALVDMMNKATALEADRRARIRKGQIVGSEITDPLDSATMFRDKILRGQDKMFQVSIYVTLRAKTLAELNTTTKLLETTLAERLFYTKVARLQQLEALQSVLPRAEDQLAQKRNLDSECVALTFPFMSSELVQENGILYGVNNSNNSLVIIDRFSLNNANSIVFAQSGSGKSYASKVEILRQLMQGTKVIVIDPEREYKNLADSVHGTYIKLSSKSTEKINPFDLASTGHSDEHLSQHIQDLTEVIALMAEGLTARERAAVDKAIIKIYKQAKKGEAPLLEDLCAELNNLSQLELNERLEKYLTGSLAGVLNRPTNIKLENRLVVFDIKDLDESLRQIMMMIIANFVQNKVKATPEKRVLVIDEGWLLLEHEESARFVAGLVRRARKYYLGVSIISQQANDFLNNEYGKAIVSQSSLRILMHQDTTTIKHVTSEFNLSEYEAGYLLTCGRGDALIIADQNHVALKVVASEDEHPLITTNPAEVHRNES
jgi:conjugal transfer ATP-binding protein TraC